MKRVLLMAPLFLMTLLLGATAQAATFTSAASGDWATPATWSVSGVDADGIPDGDDSVTINSPRTVTVNGAQSVQNLNVNGGTLSINGGSTLTMSGTPSSTVINNATVNGAGTFRTQGGTTFDSTGPGTSFSAPLEINSGTTTVTTSTIAGSISVLAGATLQVSASNTVTANGDVTINSGGTLSGLNASSTFNPNANIVNNGSVTLAIFRFDGGAQTVSGAGTFTGTTLTIINPSVTTLGSDVTIGNGSSAVGFTVNAGGTLSLGGFILTFNGVNFTNDGTVSGTGTFRTQGATTVDSTGAGTTFSAPLEINSSTTTINTSTISGSISILSGATLQLSASNTVSANGDVTINSGGTLSGLNASSTFNAGGANIINNGSVTVAIFRFSRSGAQTLSGVGSLSANTVTILNGSTTTLGSNHQLNTLVINAGGTFDITNLTLSLSGAGTPLTNNGTFTTAGSTIVYNGTGAQTVTTANVNYNNLTINNAAGATLSAAETVPGTLTLTNGVFTTTLSSARTVNGTLFLNSGVFSNGANLTMASGTAIQRDAGSLSAAPSFGASVNIVYTGASAVTTGPEVPSAATVLNNLTINKAGGVNLGGNATVNGTLSLSTGPLDVGSSVLVINNGTSVTGGSLTSGVTGTVNYNQSSNGQNVLAGSYGNLIFSNFNKVLPAATINIAGTFTTGTAVGHTITGNTINFNGGGSQTIPAFNYNNLTSSNSGARTLQSTGTIRVASVFTSGGNSYTVTGSTVEYNGVIAQTLPTSFTPYNNLTINNPAGVNGSGVAGLTVNGLLRVQAGTFTSASTYNVVQIDSGTTLAATPGSTITVSGNWTNNGSFTASTGTINLNGSAGQVINGSSATVFNNLTINNAAGATLSSVVSLGASATVEGAFTRTSGSLSIGANTLTLNGAINATTGLTGGASSNRSMKKLGSGLISLTFG